MYACLFIHRSICVSTLFNTVTIWIMVWVVPEGLQRAVGCPAADPTAGCSKRPAWPQGRVNFAQQWSDAISKDFQFPARQSSYQSQLSTAARLERTSLDQLLQKGSQHRSLGTLFLWAPQETLTGSEPNGPLAIEAPPVQRTTDTPLLHPFLFGR